MAPLLSRDRRLTLQTGIPSSRTKANNFHGTPITAGRRATTGILGLCPKIGSGDLLVLIPNATSAELKTGIEFKFIMQFEQARASAGNGGGGRHPPDP